MTVRAVEWKLPYTWWKAITVDENKVISLNLRDENNLIIYDEGDNEIYVDLQLPAWIRPNYAFPVWITTGRVLVADDWDVTWTILVAKTTSWDVIKLLYGDDWTLWMDNGTGLFKQIYFKADVDLIITNLTNYINTELAKKQDKLTAGTGISIIDNEIANNWVTSFNGNTGAVTYTAPVTSVNGSTWAVTVTSDVVVSSQANNILTSWMKIRAGTETNYGNLGTYDSNTLYLTIE